MKTIIITLALFVLSACAHKPYDIQYCEYCQDGGCTPAVPYRKGDSICWTSFKCSLDEDTYGYEMPVWEFRGFIGGGSKKLSTEECWHYGLALEDFLNQVNTGQHAVDIFPRREF